MGFIKWIGLFSGFAQTQSVLGAIAGFVIGSVIDSIWSGDSKPTAAQSSTETTSTSAEDSHNVSISFEKTIKKVSYLKTFLQKE